MIPYAHRGPLMGLSCLICSGLALAFPGPGEDNGPAAAGAGPSSVPRLIEDHFVDTVADTSGPVHVSLVDGQGFAPGDHGQRVTDNFLANTKRSLLVQIGGWGIYELGGRRLSSTNAAGFIRHALERGGGIFFTSTDDSPLYFEATAHRWFLEGGRAFHKDAGVLAAWMQDQDTLFVSSLENPTALGLGRGAVFCDDFSLDAEGGWIPLCGALDDYIAHSGVGLDRTLFVGAIDSYGYAGAAIRGDGVFARHAVYVESPDGSTSQATPVLAAYATNLAFSNPTWGAARLKRELMKLAVEEVVDHYTGASNDLGQSIVERRVIRALRPAFAPRGDPPSTGCVPDAETFCLQGSRYKVTAEWWTVDGKSGSAQAAAPRTGDSGLFWFFDPDNWEILIKVLDGCSSNGHIWVFGASTTDLGYTIAVQDTLTGRERRYGNEAGRPAPAITDVTAFAESCPQAGAVR